jgi:flagellum-specific peptidoglycan hydrolase FlgJ
MQRFPASPARLLGRLIAAVLVFGALTDLSWELGSRLSSRLDAATSATDPDVHIQARAITVKHIAAARALRQRDQAAGDAALATLYGDVVDPKTRATVSKIMVSSAADWPTDSRGRFLRAIAPAAIKAGRDAGIPPSITMAQAALESGWGRSRLARHHHNLFGVKATGIQRAIAFPTREQTPTGMRKVRQAFRVFADDAESLRHHARLLSRDSRYAAAKDTVGWQAYLNAIAPVYATDRAYARTIGVIIRRHRLDRWDAVVQPGVGGSQS